MKRRELVFAAPLALLGAGCLSDESESGFEVSSRSFETIDRKCATESVSEATATTSESNRRVRITGRFASEDVCLQLVDSMQVSIGADDPNTIQLDIERQERTSSSGCEACGGVIRYVTEVSFTGPLEFLTVRHYDSNGDPTIVIDREIENPTTSSSLTSGSRH